MLMRRLLDGELVTHDGPVYPMKDALVAPRPVQARLPIMIGGSGPKKTLRTLAKYGDQWNTMGRSRSSPSATRSCASTARPSGGTSGDRADDDGRHRHPRHAGRGAPRVPGPPRRQRRGVDETWNSSAAPRRRSRTASGRSWTSASGTSSSTRPRRTTSRRSTGSARCSSTSTGDREAVTGAREGPSSRSPAGSAARSWPTASRPAWATGLAVIVNTGDDCRRHGLLVMPDHDTVLYNLAGIEQARWGWGIEGDTYAVDGAAGRVRRGDVVRPGRPGPRAAHRADGAGPRRAAA